MKRLKASGLFFSSTYTPERTIIDAPSNKIKVRKTIEIAVLLVLLTLWNLTVSQHANVRFTALGHFPQACENIPGVSERAKPISYRVKELEDAMLGFGGGQGTASGSTSSFASRSARALPWLLNLDAFVGNTVLNIERVSILFQLLFIEMANDVSTLLSTYFTR